MTKFGATTKSFTIGKKYDWKPDQNPPVGGYDLDSGYKTMSPHNRSVIIKPATSPFRRPKEATPEPGQYDAHLTKFGETNKSFTIGQKKPAVYNQNPGPGDYNPNDSIVKSKSSTAIIREETYKLPKREERNPSPGQYDGHLKSFGSDVKGSVDFGNKYITKVDRNPGVGYYNPNESMTKSKSVSTIIKKTNKVEKSRTIFPNERDESPDFLSSEFNSFGKGAKGFTIGLKAKDEVKQGPGPGEYDTDASLNLTKGSINQKTYIAADNDFEGRNSFQNASQARYSNKYLYKNMSPDSKSKVDNLNKS